MHAPTTKSAHIPMNMIVFLVLKLIYTCTHMHAYTNASIHTYIHKQAPTTKSAHRPMNMILSLVLELMYAYTHIHAYTHASIHTHKRPSCAQTYEHDLISRPRC